MGMPDKTVGRRLSAKTRHPVPDDDHDARENTLTLPHIDTGRTNGSEGCDAD